MRNNDGCSGCGAWAFLLFVIINTIGVWYEYTDGVDSKKGGAKAEKMSHHKNGRHSLYDDNGVGSFKAEDGTGIYICTGPQSECYHRRRYCRGLKNCSSEVVEVTLDKARRIGRRPCGHCFRGR